MKLKQFGDFQTPLDLARQILQGLGPVGPQWDRVLEPTCGRGNFIRGLLQLDSPPREIIGIEIQDSYYQEAQSLASSSVQIIHGDIFQLNLARALAWKTTGPLLVIGNPPWVTNAEIGSIGGDNLPRKKNIKRLRGIEAIMGPSNFDLAEFIWIKLIQELAVEQATIALLCKTSVVRNLLSYAQQARWPIGKIKIRALDAKKWFGASVGACLLSLQTGMPRANYHAQVLEPLDASARRFTIGFCNGHLVSDQKAYQTVSFLEGASPFQWRQGIKHDAAAILELTRKDGEWFNGKGDRVEVEEEFIFPLLKGSDVQSFHGQPSLPRAVIVPQKEIGQDTRVLQEQAPRLWHYLSDYAGIFQKRKSSIYNNKPPFSIFGVGNYSFSPYKVIVSGLHKSPRFIAVGPVGSKPVFCDDTCYLLPCHSSLQAAVIAALLNHSLAQTFLQSIIFRDAKRPITKTVLRRINLLELARRIPCEDVRETIGSTLGILETSKEKEYPKVINLIEALELHHQTTQPSLFGP
jgi:hypothetical protein